MKIWFGLLDSSTKNGRFGFPSRPFQITRFSGPRLKSVAGSAKLFFYALVLLGAFSCKSDITEKTQPSSEQALVTRGRAVYQTSCISCHNPDPRKAGALGPDVAGSSLPLLEARILYANYPEGYKPKRETHQMPALPHLKADIPAIHAYLNSQ